MIILILIAGYLLIGVMMVGTAMIVAQANREDPYTAGEPREFLIYLALGPLLACIAVIFGTTVIVVRLWRALTSR